MVHFANKNKIRKKNRCRKIGKVILWCTGETAATAVVEIPPEIGFSREKTLFCFLRNYMFQVLKEREHFSCILWYSGPRIKNNQMVKGREGGEEMFKLSNKYHCKKQMHLLRVQFVNIIK